MIVIVLLLGLWIACDCTEGEACIKIVNWIQILVRDCELVCQPGLWLSFYQNCRQQNLCNEVSQWSTSILCILAMCWNYMATLLMGSLSFVSLYLCICLSLHTYLLVYFAYLLCVGSKYLANLPMGGLTGISLFFPFSPTLCIFFCFLCIFYDNWQSLRMNAQICPEEDPKIWRFWEKICLVIRKRRSIAFQPCMTLGVFHTSSWQCSVS